MLQKPFLALCADRNRSPQSNIVTGSPEDWFDNSVLNQKNLTGFSFDFFVNWTTNQISPFAWVKRIMRVNPNSLFANKQIDVGIISNEIINFDGEDYLKLFVRFCTTHNLTLQYVLFREIDWASAPENIFIATVTSVGEELRFAIEAIEIIELQRRIRNYSGGSVRIGLKGLIYGTSRLECFLSKTDSLYPGDVDLIVVDSTTMEIKSILEFKKHNLATAIENEKLGNYYPNPDKRKYDRLAILGNYLAPVPKLMCIYYPTRSNENGKAEIIKGKIGELTSGSSKTIRLPRLGDVSTYDFFVNEVLHL